MKTLLTLTALLMAGMLLASSVIPRTRDQQIAQWAYSCGYTAGIYRALGNEAYDSDNCRKMRAQFGINKDGSK